MTADEEENTNFFGCACNGTLDIMVGSGGSIMKSSHTSLIWEKLNIEGKNTLLDVFYKASMESSATSPQETKFYAVGHNGTVLMSDDGFSWTSKNAPNDAHLFAVASNRNRIVAVGHKKVVYVSDDEGNTWQNKYFVANKRVACYDVAFGDDKWLAVGDYGAVLVIDDAKVEVSEKQVQLGINKTLKGIAFNSSLKRWVVVGHEGIIFLSDDAGQTWQEKKSDTKEDLLSIAFNGKRFVAVGTHGIILTSKDGNIWHKVQINNNGTFRAVSYIAERWLLVTIDGQKEVLEDAKIE